MARRLLIGFLILFVGHLLLTRPTDAALATGKGDMTGIVRDVRFTPPDAEPRVILAEVDLEDGRGQLLTFVINLDTIIRDPQWHFAYVSYVAKGNRIKVSYVVGKDGVNTAKIVQMIQE